MDLDKINQFREEERRKKEKAQADAAEEARIQRLQGSVNSSAQLNRVSGDRQSKVVADSVSRSGSEVKEAVRETGKNLLDAVQSSQSEVAEALNNLVVATVISKDPEIIETAKSVANLLETVAKASDDFKGSKLNLLPLANEKLAKSIDKLAGKVVEKPEKDYTEELRNIQKIIAKIDVSPVVNVPETKLDIQPVVQAVQQLQKAINNQKAPEVNVDLNAVTEGLSAVQGTIKGLKFPVPNYILPFTDNTGKATQALLNDDGGILTRGSSLGNIVSGTATNTDGSSTAVIAAQAGYKTYLTDVTIANTSSSGIYVELKDGSTSKWVFPVPANGGVTHRFESPIAGSTNTAWNFDPSAATTTIYCSAAGFTSTT